MSCRADLMRARHRPSDAAYVALAERLDSPLVTCDSRLVTASGTRCMFELIS